jgi:hypothetical protein
LGAVRWMDGVAWPVLFVAIIAEERAAPGSPGSRRSEMFMTMLMAAAGLLGIRLVRGTEQVAANP